MLITTKQRYLQVTDKKKKLSENTIKKLNADKAFKSHNATGFFAWSGEPGAEGDSRVATGREHNNKDNILQDVSKLESTEGNQGYSSKLYGKEEGNDRILYPAHTSVSVAQHFNPYRDNSLTFTNLQTLGPSVPDLMSLQQVSSSSQPCPPKDFVDGRLQAWCERLPKKGVLYWWDGPVLAAEQNLEGHSAQTFS
ncbi:hypothetical protein Anapl_12657 [Anas platyrhynchos]|uniref:Uncharacterized protein n=1 Tax=Anas platyrhynchos TaxID=8839 RepID=R0M555_ANAPL|nr:hypothetical protein Anapl_12657 [Anas platyrhynchos]